MTTTLYLTRTGLLEPLGQSQILPYLRGLAKEYEIVLITCEKDKDWRDAATMERLRDECRHHGIDWRPRRFRSRPRILGPALDLIGMFGDSMHAVREDGVRLIHARSYLPVAIAWLVRRRTKIPFVFDMRALWLEERIGAGRMRRGSLVHRGLRVFEKICLRDAAATVSLTRAAAAYLEERAGSHRSGHKIVVIPTCADLRRFTPAMESPEGPDVHGCIGTILSGWFLTDWLANWFAAIAARDPAALFELVSRDNPGAIRRAIDPWGALEKRLTVAARRPEDMPVVIRGHATSAMFFTSGVGKLGSAPTRLAEILGSGIPVVANGGVGDVAQIIREHRVGVIVNSADKKAMSDAYDRLGNLRQDDALRGRCRQVAEQLFSLESGTRAYGAIYRSLLTREQGSAA